MTCIRKPVKERLYLDREGQRDVYVDTFHLAQHQIEGIRFLYRRYTNKKPGVIINNPEGYGKSIQVALFLDSIRELLTNPVLILCEDENKINNWKQTLLKWTKYTEEDLVVDSTNVYVRKKIFLKKGMSLVAPYSRRDWGVVVVKSDFILKQLVNTPVKATFKIWLTTIDVQKDLEMFNSIYCWLYSEKKFDINTYIDSISDIIGVPLVREKLMKSFMEDIVIIKNDFTPSKKPEQIQEKSPPKTNKSKKNKDVTGKKIKRSKTTEESEVASDNDINSFDLVANSKENIENVQIVANNSEDAILDVENFIKQKEPVICEEYEFLDESSSSDADMSFTNALNDVIETENDVIGMHSETDDEVNIFKEKINTIIRNTDDNSVPVSPKTASSNTDKCIDAKTAELRKNKRDIIQAITEMEERAMKKFKNTILDSFF
ncbi:PREDICTED: uncharacterized protein LOC106107375 [Papilio polytes]|uniref:uncharacterized protein LOC106107375 n=1 Tax=Papilio polytes TaxID=76194 RepID=UPI000676ADF1|nr:PREDICTED: uncharacterized protein LOC106107375 [Papilio polytes]XP_013143666.1 PREDICTED: uncharacterized protein LOC106107375 [Papilio polytes]